MEFRERFNYYFRNTKNRLVEAKFRINKPDMLKNNLDNKKIRIQKFYTNNTVLPQFIPERITPATKNYFNVTTDAKITKLVNEPLTVDSLKYYIIVRDIANTEAVVAFIPHSPHPNHPSTISPPPLTPISDDFSYYTNRYYYYYDFTHFLNAIQNAIIDARLVHTAGAQTNPINPIFWQNTQFQFFIQNGTASSPNWYIDFSQSLVDLLPFKTFLTPDGHYRILFDSTPATINGAQYYEADAPFYDTIFPFTEVLFRSEDANLNPINFIDDSALETNAQKAIFENSILAYDIDTNNFNGIYNFYKYVNENDTEFVNFNSEKDVKDHLTVQLFLRLKNDIVIPYLLNQGERCKFTLEIKFDEKTK